LNRFSRGSRPDKTGNGPLFMAPLLTRRTPFHKAESVFCRKERRRTWFEFPHRRRRKRLGTAGICVSFPIMQKTILAFLDDDYEDLELWYPKLRLEEAGYTTRMAAPEIKTYRGKHGYPAKADLLIADARTMDFDGLYLAGGWMPDRLRRDPKVLQLVRDSFEQGKMVAFICHGGSIAVSAKIIQGRRVTGSLGIKDDLENAGGRWMDGAVVVDGNLISSRTPKDLPMFVLAMTKFLRR